MPSPERIARRHPLLHYNPVPMLNDQLQPRLARRSRIVTRDGTDVLDGILPAIERDDAVQRHTLALDAEYLVVQLDRGEVREDVRDEASDVVRVGGAELLRARADEVDLPGVDSEQPWDYRDE